MLIKPSDKDKLCLEIVHLGLREQLVRGEDVSPGDNVSPGEDVSLGDDVSLGQDVSLGDDVSPGERAGRMRFPAGIAGWCTELQSESPAI